MNSGPLINPKAQKNQRLFIFFEFMTSGADWFAAGVELPFNKSYFTVVVHQQHR
jgi:hypothetical protein